MSTEIISEMISELIFEMTASEVNSTHVSFGDEF